MLRQNLGDLNGYLFEQLERLNEPDLTQEEISFEVERAKAVAGISEKIIRAGELALKTERLYERHMTINAKVPAMLESNTAEVID